MFNRIIILLSIAVSTPLLSLAQTQIDNPLTSNTITEFVKKFAGPMKAIGSAVVALVIAYGAFLYVTSGGNEQRAQTGRQVITWAVLGMVLLLLAQNVPTIICGYFNTYC